MKNKILAILAAPAAIPPKPNTPAIMAKMIKMIVQRNIIVVFFKLVSDYPLIGTLQMSFTFFPKLAVFRLYVDSKK